MNNKLTHLDTLALSCLFGATLLSSSAFAGVIQLNSGVLRTDSVEAKALAVGNQSFSGKRLFLLQFPGPTRDVWMAQLQASGAHVLNAIPENAYLLYADASALQKLKALVHSGVASWVGALPTAAKLQARNKGADLAGDSVLSFDVQLVRDSQANASTKTYLADSDAKIIQSFDVLQFHNLVVQMRFAELSGLLDRSDVISIDFSTPIKLADERQAMILAGEINVDNEPNSGNYLEKLAQWGFTQQQFRVSGLVVDVADTGADRHPLGPDPGTMPLNANAGPVQARHFSFYENGDRTQPSRFVYKGQWSELLPTQELAYDGHGLINMNIVGGYVPDSLDSANGLVHRDAQGFRYGMGVAPFVRMGNTVMVTRQIPSFPNYPKMVAGAHASGARISSISWGGSAGVYNNQAQAYDVLTRDARTDTALDQPILFLISSGNSGPGAGTINAPGTAKNVLTVGASENVRSVSEANGGLPGSVNGATLCGDSDVDANSASDMTYFSARGAASDGRQKPEIVAPGSHITGISLVAAETNPLLPVNNLGANDPLFTAGALCGLLGSGQVGSPSNYFPFVTGQRWYTISSGTSHSTPAVAGGAALVYQQFLNNPGYLAAHRTPLGNRAPSPALVKAYILNSARYLTGEMAGDSLPSMAQGMGAMNLSTAFDRVQRVIRDQAAEDNFTDSGQSRSFLFRVVDASKPVRVSLVYTDAPGSTIGNAYVNDLNLILTRAGSVYLGNVYSGALSIEGGQADAKNNHEHVFLPAGTSAGTEVEIRIEARAIIGDGLPGNSDLTDQDFALVGYNLQPADFYFANGFE